jgi:DNA-binding NtrC family response regulator
VLIIDDDPFVGEVLVDFLGAATLGACWSGDPVKGLEAALTGEYHVLVLDIMMPELDGLTLLERLKASRPEVEVVMLTARSDMTMVDRALALGAFEYLLKPPSLQKLVAVVRNAMTHRLQSLGENVAPLATGTVQDGFLVAGQETARALSWARQTAPYCATALIQGPRGSGKRQLARALAGLSGRPAERSQAVELAALAPADQGAAILGGLGAARGAHAVGALKQADGGVLVLCDVDRLARDVQAALLSLLDTGQVIAPPYEDEDFLDVKLVATANADLATAVAGGALDEDLARRLQMVTISLAPLAARLDEILPLAGHFLAEVRGSGATGRAITGFAPATERSLLGYPWPGNVAELRSAVIAAARGCAGPLVAPADLPESVRNYGRDLSYHLADKFLKSH